MKKLLVSLLAIAGMVACTNDEVVSVQQGNPIAFDTFVENTTRVGYDSSNLPEGFNVWAFMENANGRSTILDAEDVERQGNQYVYGNTQYWVPDNTYYFAALAPMDSQNVTNLVLATGDAAKKGLGTFDFDNDNGTEDLIYAVKMVEASDNTSKVTFSFNHLLSKVKFSFTNTFDNENYSIEVRDIAMKVPMSGKVNLAADVVKWTPGSTLIGLNFGTTGRIAKDDSANSAELLTIPAGDTQVYDVVFFVDLYVGNGAEDNKVLAKTYKKESQISGIKFEAGKAYNFAAAINAESLALNEVIFDASVGGWDPTTPVQLIDTAAELVDAFGNENVNHIILDGNIDLSDLLSAGTLSTRAGEPTYGLLIPAGRTLTLDLNGCTISQSKAQTGAYAMIDNKGTLIIENNSSLKEGKIVYGDTGNGGNYVSNTISNSGVLTINSGTIENNSSDAVASNGYPHPIDNSGVLTINGGTFTNSANYSSMRIWCTTDDNTIVTINGGTFNGSIDFQTPNASANKGTLTINGGTFNPDTFTQHSVRLLGFGTDVDEMNGYIKGGHFTGKISLRNFTSNEFNSQVFYITGGTFTVDPSEFVDSDYNVVENNGVYSLALKNVIAKIGDVEYRTLQKAFDAVDNGTIQLVDNVTLMETATLAEGKVATLDLNGKTITGTFAKGAGAIIENNGTLTIVGGTIKNTDENGDAVINNAGELVLDGVKINGAPIGETGYPNYAVYTSGTLVVENETEIISDRGVINLKNGADVTINGGNFVVTNAIGKRTLTAHAIYAYGSSSKLTINGGHFEMNIANGGGTSVICPAGATIKVYGGDFYHAPVEDVQSGCFQNYMGYGAPVDVYRGTFNDDTVTKSGNIAEGSEATEANGIWTVRIIPVAQIGETKYETLEAAIAAAKAGDTITLLRDITLAEELGLPADITLDGNGKQINGSIYASGDLTFAGHTKVTAFSASYYNRVITIGEGACLEVTGGGRVSLAYGNTFNITGSIDNAKTADKANIQPSLIIPGGISITGGNDATMNVTNAYISLGNTSSKNSSANGKFTLNFTNSIIECTNQFTLSEPTGGKNPEFEVNITNSVMTTTAKLCIAAANSKVVVNNSILDLKNNFRNSGIFTLENGSVMTGSTIQFGENGGNNGTINVDASTLTITAGNTASAFDGKGTGSINATNGATVSVDYYKDMAINVDATSTFTGVDADANKKIYYVSEEMKLEPTNDAFGGAVVVSNAWDKTTGKGVITFDRDLTTIGEKAFQRVTNTTPSNWATSITLPESVKTIGNYAFYMCYSLKVVNIPNKVVSIGERAFGSCSDLVEINCEPTTPPTLGDGAFANVSATCYVPATSENAYEAAWSDYEGNIEGR